MGKDDVTGEQLIQRKDDTPEALKKPFGKLSRDDDSHSGSLPPHRCGATSRRHAEFKESVGSPQCYDCSFLRSYRGSLRYDRDFLRDDRGSLRYDRDFLRYDRDFLRYDRDFLRCDRDFLRYDRDFLRYDRGSLRYDRDFLRLHSFFMINTDILYIK